MPRRFLLSVLLLVLSLAGIGVLPAVAAVKRAMTIEDYYRFAWPSGLTLSSDGKTLVYSVGTNDLSRAEAFRDLWRIDLTDGSSRRLTWTDDAAESGPVFSPDGRRIAFIAKRGEQTHAQIWLMDVGGGEAKSLTDVSTGVDGLAWSPDGRRIAFTSEVYPECGADDTCNAEKTERRTDGPVKAHVADELLYRHWASWSDGKVAHVLVADAETGETRDLTPGDRDAPVFTLGGPLGYDFSPDGKELCFARNPDPKESLSWSTNSDLWVVAVDPDEDGGTREARRITADNPAWDHAPRYSPDGRYIAYLRQSKPGYESDLIGLALYDRESGKTSVLTPGFDNWVGAFAWLPDSSGLVFEAPFEGATPLYRVSIETREVEKLAQLAYLDEFVLSPDGGTAYVMSRAIGAPKEVWKLDLTGKSPRARLSHHNLEVENEVDVRPAETMWVEGADGKRIHVFVVKPHGFDPSRKYPLVFNVHGGPQGMWADAFRGDWQIYPGAGYVVAFANPHGSTGYGQELTAQISGDWGGKVFEDLMKVVDALEELPYVDGDRMGAMGWSYGGYMMNWFQGHTDRFKCLASMMGLFDLRSFYLTTEELWFPEWDLGGMPWNSELYETWNPANAVERFKTPELIIGGERDFRVPYTQSLMAFTALRRRGVPAKLVVLPEAGHWPGWYEMALYYTAHLDWFHRWLGGDPPPWSLEDFADNAVFDRETGERIDTDD